MFAPLSSAKRSEWAEKIRQQRNSGFNATSWCRKHQIAYSTFVYWKDCLSSKAPMRRSSFIESPDAFATAKVSIEYQGVRIHLDKGDLVTLKNCLSALRKTRC